MGCCARVSPSPLALSRARTVSSHMTPGPSRSISRTAAGLRSCSCRVLKYSAPMLLVLLRLQSSCRHCRFSAATCRSGTLKARASKCAHVAFSRSSGGVPSAASSARKWCLAAGGQVGRDDEGEGRGPHPKRTLHSAAASDAIFCTLPLKGGARAGLQNSSVISSDCV